MGGGCLEQLGWSGSCSQIAPPKRGSASASPVAVGITDWVSVSLSVKWGPTLWKCLPTSQGAAVVLAWPLGWCEERGRKKQQNSRKGFICLAFRSPSLPPSHPDFISGCQSGVEGGRVQRARTAPLWLWWTQPRGLREKAEAEVQPPSPRIVRGPQTRPHLDLGFPICVAWGQLVPSCGHHVPEGAAGGGGGAAMPGVLRRVLQGQPGTAGSMMPVEPHSETPRRAPQARLRVGGRSGVCVRQSRSAKPFGSLPLIPHGWEAEARAEVTCPESHSSRVAELGFEPGCPWPVHSATLELCLAGLFHGVGMTVLTGR